jgi:hypothetical protein
MKDRLVWVPFAIAVVAVSSLVVTTRARAHVAESGMVYPGECCNSAATSPTGDCAPIDAIYVKEAADGYHVELPIGSHPQLKTKSYSGVVPYGSAKDSEDGQYHVCLSRDGAFRFCFFAGPRLG